MKYNITPFRYLLFTGSMSLLLAMAYIAAHPRWTQNISEYFGITQTLQATEKSFYNNRIDPVFEKYCTACHDMNKDKGQLRLDSYRQLTFSGKSGSDLTSSNNNLLLERMKLPANHRLAMPPYGRERHSESELELISMWLKKGGNGQLTEDSFPDAPAKAKVIKFVDIDWNQITQNRALYSAEVKRLQQLYPHVLHYQARTSNYLILESFNFTATLNDDLFAHFSKLAPILSELNLANSHITSKSINKILSMQNLTSINLAGTSLRSDHILPLIKLKTLQKIIVNEGVFDQATIQSVAKDGIQIITVYQG